jgi:hypothetical protein
MELRAEDRNPAGLKGGTEAMLPGRSLKEGFTRSKRGGTQIWQVFIHSHEALRSYFFQMSPLLTLKS